MLELHDIIKIHTLRGCTNHNRGAFNDGILSMCAEPCENFSVSTG